MKKIIALAAMACAVSALNAQESELSVSATVAWESEYVFRGVQLSDSAFQPAVDISYGGAYLGLWTSMPVNSKDDLSREVDIYAGYGFDVSETFSIDFGATVYYYPSRRDAGLYSLIPQDMNNDGVIAAGEGITPAQQAAAADRTTVEGYIGGSFATLLNPSLYFYYDFTLENFTIEGSAGHSFAVNENVSFDLAAATGYVWVDGGQDYWYVQGSVDLVYAFTENAAFAIGTRASANDLDAPARDANWWWGVSFTAGF